MKNKSKLIREIIYRSSHRGNKEMDLLLGSFVKKYIDILDDKDLLNLHDLLNCEDEILSKWYFSKNSYKSIHHNKITKMLKEHKP